MVSLICAMLVVHEGMVITLFYGVGRVPYLVECFDFIFIYFSGREANLSFDV